MCFRRTTIRATYLLSDKPFAADTCPELHRHGGSNEHIMSSSGVSHLPHKLVRLLLLAALLKHAVHCGCRAR